MKMDERPPGPESPELDPLLLVHRLPHGEYSIAGKYNPASIKDQMVRAVSLIDRAHFHGLLTNGKKLLVVGAGAAGVSAAFQARKHEIDTTLVEEKGLPFERQRYSNRTVDPTEYDWPAPHWRDGEIKELPLPFARASAAELAAQWQKLYTAVDEQDNFLRVAALTRYVDSMPTKAGRLAALFERSDNKQRSWEEFDFILNCTGPGVERVSLEGNRHASYLFWVDDKLEAPNFGFPPASPSPQPHILISGGGDGGLQDFLRIAFPKQTPRDIYEALLPGNKFANVRLEIEKNVLAAEDAFRRAWVWGGHSTLDCKVLRQLHDAHIEAAKMAAQQVRRAGVLPDLSRIENVRLVHSCDHFSVCYAFNRFLTLLVNELLPSSKLIPRRRVRNIEPANPDEHTCQNSAPRCWEYPHKVWFSKAECGATPVQLRNSSEYRVVVLRHGPEANTPKLHRQILPYRLPWSGMS